MQRLSRGSMHFLVKWELMEVNTSGVIWVTALTLCMFRASVAKEAVQIAIQIAKVGAIWTLDAHCWTQKRKISIGLACDFLRRRTAREPSPPRLGKLC